MGTAVTTASPGHAAEAASVRVEILVADAEKLYRAQQPKQAVAKYDQASALAFSEGATGRAFELSRTAAAILQAGGDHHAAGERLRRLAIGNADHPEAAATHRAACVCLAQEAGGSAEAAAEYTEALREHLEQWPDGKSARDVRNWLVRWLAKRREWSDLLALLESTSAQDPAFAETVPIYADAVIGVRGGPDSQGVLRRATDRLQPVITGAANRWPDEWSLPQRAAALALARIHLAYDDSGPEYPRRLLTAAASGSPAASPEWEAVALPLLVESAAAAGDWEGAAQVAERAPREPSPALRRLVRFLEDQLGDVGTDARAAGLLADVTSAASRGDAPDWLRRGRAAALAARGDPRAAERLLAANSSDPAYQRLAAAALMQSSDEVDLKRALELWRRIEARSKSGDQTWRRARLGRVETLVRLARRDEATKLLAVTIALYPPPKSAELLDRQGELAQSLGVDLTK